MEEEARSSLRSATRAAMQGVSAEAVRGQRAVSMAALMAIQERPGRRVLRDERGATRVECWT